MRQYLQLAAATSLLLALTACATPAVSPVETAPVAVTANAAKVAASRQIVAEAIAQATSPVVKDMGVQDGASVAVTIDLAPAQRSVQALQHRWITSDVHTYAVSLQVKNPDASFSEVAALSINAASYNTSTTGAKALAAFTGLVANKQYKVTVQAWGSNPITPATAANQQLNVQNPVEANFDFRETSGTIETAPPAQNLAVVLDSFVFSGSATVNTTLTEGTYLPAPGGIQAAAVVPAQGVAFTGLTPGGDAKFTVTSHNIPANTTFWRLVVATNTVSGWNIYNNVGFLAIGGSTRSYDEYLLTSFKINGTEMSAAEFQTPGRLTGVVVMDVVVPGSNVERNHAFSLVVSDTVYTEIGESNFRF